MRNGIHLHFIGTCTCVSQFEFLSDFCLSRGVFFCKAHDTPGLQYTNELLTGALMAFDMVVRLRARLMPKAKRE